MHLPRKRGREGIRNGSVMRLGGPSKPSLFNSNKRSLRSSGVALARPKSTLFDMKNDKTDNVIIPTTSVLQPTLTEEQKPQRAFFFVSKLNPADNMYHGFFTTVFILMINGSSSVKKNRGAMLLQMEQV
jgi:hypothetical protein